MPKGYWIAQVDVDDFETYKTYIGANAAPLQGIRRTVSCAWRHAGGSGGRSPWPHYCARISELRQRASLLRFPKLSGCEGASRSDLDERSSHY